MFGPRIEGVRVTLAPPAPEHVGDDSRWFHDPIVTRYLNLRNPQTREQHEEYRIYLEGAFHDVWLGEVLREEWLAAAAGETEDAEEPA